MPAKISIIGQRSGKLKVLKDALDFIDSSGRHRSSSFCVCDCGKNVIVLNSNIRCGATKSCGCLIKGNGASIRHGHSVAGKTSTYRSWTGMCTRCRNEHVPEYEYYGGRGIRVCERWDKFENFLSDMGERPIGKTIDRIDNNGNYEPGNCRWATRTEQARNTRYNRFFTVRGVTGCLTDLAEIFGITYGAAQTRIIRGWPPERAFTEPVQIHRKKGTPGFS